MSYFKSGQNSRQGREAMLKRIVVALERRHLQRASKAAFVEMLIDAVERGEAGPSAPLSVGIAYAEGRGVPRDAKEAARWYRIGAEQGHTEAQFFLGVALDRGSGVPQNKAEAAQWYERAADAGYMRAQFNLAAMLWKGEGILADRERAHMLFVLAAGKGDRKAVRARNRSASELSPGIVEKAERRALEWESSNDRLPTAE